MMTASCPGFLDRYGNWNNGFDCSLSRVCCGTETDRYCCNLSTSSSTSQLSSSSSLDDSLFHTSDNFLSEKWFSFQICIIALFLTIVILIFIMIYQCLTSMRRNKHHQQQQQQQRMSFIQVPLPSASPLLIQHNRSISNRISTISCATSDIKSRCLDTSMVLNTPLNLYPTSNSSSSTSTASSSYYMFPNELEQLCK